jgi:hypothetical protein
MGKWLKAVGILAVVIATIIWIGSRPSKGKIVIKEPEKNRKDEIVQRQYEGKFLNFWYSSNYLVRAEEIADESRSEKVELQGETGDSSHWVILASPTSTEDLSEVSAVQFRRMKKDVYEEAEIEINGIKGLFFKKKDKSELLAVVIKNEQLISVALTINSNDETTEKKFTDFVSKVEIK